MAGEKIRERIVGLSQREATALGAITVFLVPFLLLMAALIFWPSPPAYLLGALIVPCVGFGLWSDAIRRSQASKPVPVPLPSQAVAEVSIPPGYGKCKRCGEVWPIAGMKTSNKCWDCSDG